MITIWYPDPMRFLANFSPANPAPIITIRFWAVSGTFIGICFVFYDMFETFGIAESSLRDTLNLHYPKVNFGVIRLILSRLFAHGQNN